ncbi:NAD(P)H-dependent oxidoreductase [Actinomadura barringtoniae]|uniref:NAD(P)H-dependent oxidoreductase n=1 Tax=Actinomadura barringtoniae TaxID=1427535 RepID=A0A939PMX4_9ACTN|nr:NAD(P)H-dependent oxidoreductase [Actinomadura barringtoniae]MBO2453003.1 NAD(P)H-dependent oxidoreductase [Actinomadura barringtoniae]
MNGIRIGVVLGSTRPQRLGERVCHFVMKQAKDVPDADFRVLDLAGYRMPFFDEAEAPLANRDRVPAENVRCWLGDLAAMDGYLFLTPEYNYTFPAVLKNALDFLAKEAEGKPAAILSYSNTMHGGNIAGNELRAVLSKLGMLPLPRSLPMAHAERLLDETGDLVEQSDWAAKVAAFVPWSLNELVRYAAALKTVRAA